ncbi:MAG: hypothetical protein Q8Q09_17120 [Deltaproteobacteria bacterium]|nr:hypothetical protein [Deltaproteobacteria bacterium]
MRKKTEAGPIATSLVRVFQKLKGARVINLHAFREGSARAAELQKTVATPEDLAEHHPVHALYIAVQNQVSVLSEQLTSLPETTKLADLIEAAQVDYMPSGPPMSPLTVSYFTSWAFFDAAVGPRRETIGTCIAAIGTLLGLHPKFLALVAVMQQSSMRVYAHEGARADGTIVLRDLVSGARVPCIVPSGWLGAPGELWLARVLPPPVGVGDASLVFTTPYVLRGASEQDWVAYLDRALAAAKSDASKTLAALKHAIDWNEYIFAGYKGHVHEAIFLTGLPDVPSSLPHYSPRSR